MKMQLDLDLNKPGEVFFVITRINGAAVILRDKLLNVKIKVEEEKITIDHFFRATGQVDKLNIYCTLSGAEYMLDKFGVREETTVNNFTRYTSSVKGSTLNVKGWATEDQFWGK